MVSGGGAAGGVDGAVWATNVTAEQSASSARRWVFMVRSKQAGKRRMADPGARTRGPNSQGWPRLSPPRATQENIPRAGRRREGDGRFLLFAVWREPFSGAADSVFLGLGSGPKSERARKEPVEPTRLLPGLADLPVRTLSRVERAGVEPSQRLHLGPNLLAGKWGAGICLGREPAESFCPKSSCQMLRGPGIELKDQEESGRSHGGPRRIRGSVTPAPACLPSGHFRRQRGLPLFRQRSGGVGRFDCHAR